MPSRASFSSLLLLLALVALPGAASTGLLLDVAIDQEVTGASVTIGCEGCFEYYSYKLQSPERFVIDLAGVTKSLAATVVPGAPGQPVTQVRLAQLPSRAVPTARLVIDLSASATAQVERVPEGFRVRFSVEEPRPAEIRAVAPLVVEPETPTRQAEPEAHIETRGPLEVEPFDATESEPEPEPEAGPEPPLPAEIEVPEEIEADPLSLESPAPEIALAQKEPESAQRLEPAADPQAPRIEPAPTPAPGDDSPAPRVESIRPPSVDSRNAPPVHRNRPSMRSDGSRGQSLQDYTRRKRTTTSQPANPRGAYEVLVFEGPDRAAANRWRARLAQSGEPTFLNISLDPDLGPRFRVFLGRFASRGDAEHAARRAATEHGLETVVLENRRPR